MPRQEPHLPAEYHRLLTDLLDDRITEAQRSQLMQFIETDAGCREHYAEQMVLHSLLILQHREPLHVVSSNPPVPIVRPSDDSPLLGSLGEWLQQGLTFLTRSNVFTILVAIGLPGLVLLLLAVSLTHQRPAKVPDVAARVVRTCECVGQLDSSERPLTTGAELAEGQRLTIRKGLVEMEFADGARAIVEAPAAFEVRHGNGVFLQMGRLAASVPAEAHGFAVETPLATVVDLGTEFGVSVTADGTSETHVFQGQVEVDAKAMPDHPAPLRSRLKVGQGARIHLTGLQKATTTIESITASPDEFVRFIPIPPPTRPATATDAGKAHKRLIASVNRRNGITHSRVPIGSFDGQTDPLPSDDSGLLVGSQLFSDRVYLVESISPELAGADYVRTFLSDKGDVEGDYSYEVTLTGDREEVFLMVLVDNRFGQDGNQLHAVVDQIVSAFAQPGEFADTGFDVAANDARRPRPLSAFGKRVPTKDASGNPIKYVFHAPPAGESTFVIAAMPDAPATAGNPNEAQKRP